MGTNPRPVENDRLIQQTWLLFKEKFKTESEAVDDLYKEITATKQIKCPKCGSSPRKRKSGQRSMDCSKCSFKIWFTAGTFFHRARAITPWRAAEFFMEAGTPISTADFQRLTGISYSACWHILRKFATVVHQSMTGTCDQARSFHFLPAMSKHSGQTPVGQRPAAEEFALLVYASEKQSELTCALGLNEFESTIYRALIMEAQDIDTISGKTGLSPASVETALNSMEASGLVENKNKQWKANANKMLPISIQASVETIIGDVKKLHRNGVSRKHLQKYLAAYWCQTDRYRWQAPALLKECLKVGEITNKAIHDFISPALVLFWSGENAVANNPS